MPQSSQRKSDAVLSICQNNDNKSIKIIEVNEQALQILGYEASELIGSDIRSILPGTIRDSIEDGLEFELGAPDISEVLRKVRHFSLKSHSGDIIPLEMKIYMGESIGYNSVFKLILRDRTVKDSIDASRDTVANLKGYEIIDESSGLPNRDSFIKDLEMVCFYIGRDNIIASLATMKLDDYDAIKAQYGQEAADKLAHDIAIRAKLNLRVEDTVGRIGDDEIGMILIDANSDCAAIALNRMRWQIRSQPVEILGHGIITPSVSIGYREITESSREDELFSDCAIALASAVKQGGNHIQLANA